MSESKHTPGPWEYSELRYYDYLAGAYDTYGQVRCEDFVIVNGCAPGHTPQAKANARLMAAAPDLLEAAQEILLNAIDADAFGPGNQGPDGDWPCDEDGDPWYHDYWALRQAIAKAEAA